MIRLLAGLLLFAALLQGADAAVAERNATLPSADSYRQQISDIETELKKNGSDWYRAISDYVAYKQYQNRLASIEQNLKTPDIVKDTAAKKRLLLEQKKIKASLSKIDPSHVRAVEYYVAPKGENLSIHNGMYEQYEKKAQELDGLAARLQTEQKALSELLKTEKEPAKISALQEQSKRVAFTLDTISRIQARLRHLSDARLTRVNELNKQMAELQDELGKSNIWQKSYTAYLTYLDVKKELADLQERIDELQKQSVSGKRNEELDALLAKQKIMTDQLGLLQSHTASPFADLLQPQEIGEQPEIRNPLDIFSGLSFNKKIRQQLSDYLKRGDELKRYLQLLLKQRQLLAQLAIIDDVGNYQEKIDALDAKIEKYQAAYSTLQDTGDVYGKRVEEIELQINKAIEEQLVKLANIGGIILFLLIFFFIMKQIAKKYISDNERFYMANKVITFVNVTLILLVLLFNYIENVSYLVTVLGFASAGIAIAMKDWFMSMLGWLVIVFGGSIHVGDRVRVDKDGKQYVGDVLDISLLRITILEDITLTTYMHNRRAGRVIFIPNNYIFTEMIANYTHVSLKTVWDGIDITVTFDSNHKKAQHIAKEITRKYAKGYTDITRQQLNKLRSRYNLKNTNVDPRIYAFAEENGVRISAWYLTNAYATLTLRSTISMEILDAFGKEDDITIAYPTQRLRLQNEPLPQPRLPNDEDGAPV
jgi:small-conductance mechanosensitive channel